MAIVVLVLTLLAYGWPIPAIEAAFAIDERTVADWHKKAVKHGQRLQSKLVCNGQVELGQVQMDELCINGQGFKAWVAAGMTVFSRLFIWGEVSLHRNRSLIERVVQKVHAAASGLQPVVFAVDGLAAYPNAIRKSSGPTCTSFRSSSNTAAITSPASNVASLTAVDNAPLNSSPPQRRTSTMQAQRTEYFTTKEYLDMERVAPTKSEYYAGEIFAMAGASPRHTVVVANVVYLLVGQLKGHNCDSSKSRRRSMQQHSAGRACPRP